MAKEVEKTVDVNDVSHISAGAFIKGDFMCPSDIRVDGKIEGKIQSSGRIVVGESAEIKGTIICTMLDFWGKLDGDAYVRDTLSLKEGSSVKGNLNIRKLQVEIGSSINGSCHMMTEEEFDKIA